MNLNDKYGPICLSELEKEYPIFEEYLNTNKTFIVNGPRNCGKSTIVKLYLKLLNYDYLLLDDPGTSKDYINDKLQFATKSVFSYFFEKKYVVLIDNFDQFDTSIKELLLKYSTNSQFIIITNKYLNCKINYIRINNYSHDYLMNLYVTIYFLETNYNYLEIPEFENISQMFVILEFNINTLKNKIKHKKENSNRENSKNSESDYKLIFDKYHYEYNDLVSEKDFKNKLYILDKFTSYSIFQNNIIYNYNDIHKLADSYDYLSNSLYFLESGSSINLNNNINFNLEFYPILSIIGTTYKLDSFKIHKENFQIRKKKNFKNNF